MTPPTDRADQEALAVKRFYIIGAVRIAGVAVLMLGIAIAQNALDAPYELGFVLAVGGAAIFFFGPNILARKWKNDQADHSK